MERGAELFGLCLDVGGPGGRLTDFLVGRRVGLLQLGIADRCGLGGAKRLDLLTGVAAAKLGVSGDGQAAGTGRRGTSGNPLELWTLPVSGFV